jgi:hypothetical protein
VIVSIHGDKNDFDFKHRAAFAQAPRHRRLQREYGNGSPYGINSDNDFVSLYAPKGDYWSRWKKHVNTPSRNATVYMKPLISLVMIVKVGVIMRVFLSV